MRHGCARESTENELVKQSGANQQLLNQLGSDLHEGAPEGVLLTLVKDVKDQMPHVFDVTRCSFGHERVSCSREDRAVEAPVYRIGLSNDETALLQAAHEMR